MHPNPNFQLHVHVFVFLTLRIAISGKCIDRPLLHFSTQHVFPTSCNIHTFQNEGFELCFEQCNAVDLTNFYCCCILRQHRDELSRPYMCLPLLIPFCTRRERRRRKMLVLLVLIFWVPTDGLPIVTLSWQPASCFWRFARLFWWSAGRFMPRASYFWQSADCFDNLQEITASFREVPQRVFGSAGSACRELGWAREGGLQRPVSLEVPSPAAIFRGILIACFGGCTRCGPPWRSTGRVFQERKKLKEAANSGKTCLVFDVCDVIWLGLKHNCDGK